MSDETTTVKTPTTSDHDLDVVAELAAQLRVDSIRASTSAGSGHPTSSMSAADLLAVLVARHLRFDWDDPHLPTNDHLIFSKGHASPAALFGVQGGGCRGRPRADDGVPALWPTAGGPPDAGAPLGRCGDRIARAGTAGRRRHRARREVPRAAPVSRVGALRRQRGRRGIDLGGARQGVLLLALELRRDDRRQPARATRPDGARMEPRGLRRARQGLRHAGDRGGRPRPRCDRRRPRGGRGRRSQGNRDSREDDQGPRLLGGRR